MAAGDFDGDRFADVVVSAGSGGGPVYVVYLGADLVRDDPAGGSPGRVCRTPTSGAVWGWRWRTWTGTGRTRWCSPPGPGPGRSCSGSTRSPVGNSFGTFVGDPGDRGGAGNVG